jgi:hypothetical protein
MTARTVKIIIAAEVGERKVELARGIAKSNF